MEREKKKKTAALISDSVWKHIIQKYVLTHVDSQPFHQAHYELVVAVISCCCILRRSPSQLCNLACGWGPIKWLNLNNITNIYQPNKRCMCDYHFVNY